MRAAAAQLADANARYNELQSGREPSIVLQVQRCACCAAAGRRQRWGGAAMAWHCPLTPLLPAPAASSLQHQIDDAAVQLADANARFQELHAALEAEQAQRAELQAVAEEAAAAQRAERIEAQARYQEVLQSLQMERHTRSALEAELAEAQADLASSAQEVEMLQTELHQTNATGAQPGRAGAGLGAGPSRPALPTPAAPCCGLVLPSPCPAARSLTHPPSLPPPACPRACSQVPVC